MMMARILPLAVRTYLTRNDAQALPFLAAPGLLAAPTGTFYGYSPFSIASTKSGASNFSRSRVPKYPAHP
jgi:hypothetical protein